MEEGTLVLNVILLNNHVRCMDIQAGDDSADSAVSVSRHSSCASSSAVVLRSVQKLIAPRRLAAHSHCCVYDKSKSLLTRAN